ncbi:hypothetical protein ACH41H_43825 [Streptomyces sp. NPDC020800]|uniref:hypothetical protein n=1 Tax=Streptomyces sp. NPDC020800 TaxID=3365092 RepID=UPI003794A4F6
MFHGRRRPCELDERPARQATALHTGAPAVDSFPRRGLVDGTSSFRRSGSPKRGSSPGVDEAARQRTRTALAQDADQHRSRGAPLGVSHGLGDEVPALTAGLLNPKAPLAEEDVTSHSTCAAVVMSRPTPRYRVPSRRADW